LLARSAVLAIRAPPFKVLFATTLMEDAPRFFNLHRFRYYLGLLNCGYSRNERQMLQAHWSSKLNDSHLLRNRRDALRFIQVCNARVPEHAPFFAYAIYAIGTGYADDS